MSADERWERIAWSVATNTALQTKEDPVTIHERLMKRYREHKEKEV